jgi:hypothetical protein
MKYSLSNVGKKELQIKDSALLILSFCQRESITARFTLAESRLTVHHHHIREYSSPSSS